MCSTGRGVRAEIQRLAPDLGDVCRGCGKRVRFRIKKSVKTKNGGRYLYLACPVCGQRATRMRLV